MTEGVERLTYSVEEAAEAVGVGRDTMHKLVAEGRIPHITYGRGARIPIESLRQWLIDEAELNTGRGTVRV